MTNSDEALANGGQRKLDIITECTDIPFRLLKLQLSTLSKKMSRVQTTLFLPSTFNMFIMWKNLENVNFNEMWSKAISKKTAKPYKSVTKKINANIWNQPNDLKNFFPLMVESSDKAGRFCLGGCFNTMNNNKNDYLLKIAVKSQENTFVLRILETVEEKNSNKIKEFLLRTLMFLLGEDTSQNK